MQENNNKSRQKSVNSDLMNLRDDFDQFRITLNPKNFSSFNETFTNKNKTFTNFSNFHNRIYFKNKHNNLLINKNVDKNKNYNINFKIEENMPKTTNMINYHKKIKKLSVLNEKAIYKNALESIKKLAKTQINFFSHDNSRLDDNIKNIFSNFKNSSYINNSNTNNLIKKKFNKTNNFNSTKYHTIYFNSSLDNFYVKKKNDRFKSKTPFYNLNKTKYSILSPKSHCVNFINNIINLYNKGEENNNDKSNSKLNLSITKNDNDKNNENENQVQDKKAFNILGLDTFNHIALKNLFQKNSAKIKNGVLNEVLIDQKIKNNDIFLNPFMNSYGILLDDMSEKVGFMKGSIDIIYPKITQKKYQIRTLERKNKYNIKRSRSQENYKIQNNNEINNNIFNIIKPKKIIQTIFTKYPINIKRTGKKIYVTKMYSFKGRKDLINNKINKN